MAADSDDRWQRSGSAVIAVAGRPAAVATAAPTGSAVAGKLSSADWLIAAWPNCSAHYYYLHWSCVGRCVHHPDFRPASPARPGSRPDP